jgi:hypothetical protein
MRRLIGRMKELEGISFSEDTWGLISIGGWVVAVLWLINR